MCIGKLCDGLRFFDAISTIRAFVGPCQSLDHRCFGKHRLLPNGIHPTTNPVTLGKASTNGCIGTSEADAWIVYYYAPVGTPVNIRYDLNVQDDNNGPLVLDDIYDLYIIKVKN